MARYKLFRLLDTFDRNERTEAEKYLTSLGTSRGSECLRLFQGIKKMTLEAEHIPNMKEELFAILFPGKPYQDAKMRKLMTQLTHQLENFLVQKELDNDEAFRQQLLARSLEQRGDYRLFKDAIEARLSIIEAQALRGLAYFQEKQQLLQALYLHPETAKFSVDNDFFEQAMQCQIWYFVLESLLNGAESIARSRTISSNEISPFLNAAQDFANPQKGDVPVVIGFFQNLIQLLQIADRPVYLEALKLGLLQVFGRMGEREQRMALKLLVFYATPFANNGSKEHSLFIFEMYQLGIDNKLLQQGKNVLDTILYMNIAINAAGIRKLDWAAEFIENYNSLLAEEDREYAMHLCLAALNYNTGLEYGDNTQFEKALDKLALILTRADEKFDLRLRSLQLRIQFDAFLSGAKSLDDVLQHAKNFGQYLKTNPTYSLTKQVSYLNFIRYTRRLARLINQPEKASNVALEFIQELQSEQHCILRHWLLEKAEALRQPSA